MRTLMLTIGAPASGKSTLLKKYGLEAYVLSPDNLRFLFQSPEQQTDGKLSITQSKDGQVWALLFKLLEERMKRGEFTIIDATHTSTKLLNKYKKLCSKYRYRVLGIDFRDIPLETVLKQNRERKPKYKVVPEDVIKKMHLRGKDLKISKWVELIPHTENILEILNNKSMFDFNKYSKINVFGDIHGCYKEFREAFDKAQEENCFNIFVGDYFDRYVEKEEVVELLHFLNSLPRSNNLFLTGNHESGYLYLKDFFDISTKMEKDPNRWEEEYQEKVRKNIMSKTQRHTLHLFRDEGLEKEVQEFAKKLGVFAQFKFKGNTYTVSHGGVPNLISVFTPAEECIRGVGRHGDEELIAQSWYKNTPKNAYQVFGHRNIHKKDLSAYRVCNVNSDTEFGGDYVYCEITEKGIERKTIKGTRPIIVNSQTMHKVENVDNLLEAFKGHNGVRVKRLNENLFSINFTNAVFRKGNYDQFTTLARGLFLNKDGKIVARGYHKFFNLGETKATEKSYLKELSYPVEVYNKPNGFLGILSVKEDGEWLVATKSTDKGQFKDWFYELVKPYLTNELKQLILEHNITLTFEVIDPVNDPHIETYEDREVIWLDAISNEVEFTLLTKSLQKDILKAFGKPIKTKRLVATLENYEELLNFIDEHQNLPLYKRNLYEGFVFVDKNLFMFKLKTNWYSFWKHIRGRVDYLNKHILPNLKNENKLTNRLHLLKGKLYNYEDTQVIHFLIDEVLKGNIKKPFKSVIEARNYFLDKFKGE